MRFFLLLTISIAAPLMAVAQDLDMNCARNYSLYREFMRVESYDLATGPFWELMGECPDFSKGIFSHGAKIYSELIKRTNDPRSINAYLDTLKIIYARRAEVLGDRDLALESCLAAVMELSQAGKVTARRALGEVEPVVSQMIDLLGPQGFRSSRIAQKVAAGMSKIPGIGSELDSIFDGASIPKTAGGLRNLRCKMQVLGAESAPLYRRVLEGIYADSANYADAMALGCLLKSQKDLAGAARYFREAIRMLKQQAPEKPECYYLIASIYSQNAGMCAADVFEASCVYWVVEDYAIKAQAAGFMGDEVHALLDFARKHYPSQSEAFFRSIVKGSKVVVNSFDSEVTTARFAAGVN